MLPRQNVPESAKNDEWCKDTIAAIRQEIDTQSGGAMKIMDECYNLLNGRQNAVDFEYLTGKGDMKMPAKVRSLPIIRPYFDMLSATMESRPLEPWVFSVDGDSIETKQDLKARRIVESYLQEVNARQSRMSLLQQRIDMAKQEAEQQAQQGGGNPQMALGMLDTQMRSMESMLGRSQEILQEQVTNLEREHRFGFQTQNEVKCSNGLNYLIEKYGLREKFVEGLRDMYTVDNAIFAVDDIIEGFDPVLRRVSPKNVFYSAGEGVRHLRDCTWVAERGYYTAQQVMDEFGDDLSDDKIAQLDKTLAISMGSRYTGSSNWDASALAGMTLSECDPGIYAGTYGNDSSIEVIRCSWLAPRKIDYKEVANERDPSQPYIKMISDEDSKRKPRKFEKIKSVYVMDRYSGVCINGTMFVRLGLAPMQLRDIDDYGSSHHPYAGYAYNDTDNRPYSRVWAVRDIQILYQLVYYQMEVLLAMSGIKAFVMDLSQKPAKMSMERWIYNMRQGVIWIDHSRPGADGRPSNFNQFPTVDLTFGNSIAQTQGILDRLEMLAGRVIGIPPQRMGEITPNDQVGTNKQAITQSNLTTEVIFSKMNRVIKQSMDLLLNVMPHAWKNGKRGQYTMGDHGQRILQITAGELDSAKFECFFPDRGREQAKMDNAMAMITNSAMAAQMPVSQMITMFQSTSLHQLEGLLKQYEALAYKKAAEGQQAQAQHEQELAQLDAQSQQVLKNMEAGDAKLKAQVDKLAIDAEERNTQLEVQGRLQVADMNNRTAQYKSDQESAMEAANLNEIKREHNIDASLKSAELAMDQLEKSKTNISSTPTKQKVT